MRKNIRVLVACEFSGIVRDAFIERGFDAWSCDLLPTERPGNHIQGDVLELLDDGWDLMIAHPPCTRLANSGVRWLTDPPAGKSASDMWKDMFAAAEFYLKLRNADIPLKAIENPVMHRYAKMILGGSDRHIVQPHWFGEPFFKATGFELHGLPELVKTNQLEIPESGTNEYKKWSAIHRESPGLDRWKNRSRTFPGVARAMAEQWGDFILNMSDAA